MVDNDHPCPVHGGTPSRYPSSGTPARRGYGRQWRKIRAAFLAAHPHCELCGAPAEVADHIYERAQGGSDDWSNLRALCRSCHGRITWDAHNPYPDRDFPEAWRR